MSRESLQPKTSRRQLCKLKGKIDLLKMFPLKKSLTFIKVENQIQLADIVEVFVENFHKIVNRFKITQVVIVHVHTDAEVETSVATINDFEVAELEEKILLGNSKLPGFYLPRRSLCASRPER